MNAHEKAELIKVLNQKKGLLDKMMQMTAKIRTELEQDRIEAFAEAIHVRQKIITQIDSLTKAEQAFSVGDDIEVMTLKKEIRDIVASTLKQDEENTSLAQQKLQKYRDQIRHLNQTKKSVGGYTQPMNKEEAFFVDANK
jgi:predicted transcriptional regulator